MTRNHRARLGVAVLILALGVTPPLLACSLNQPLPARRTLVPPEPAPVGFGPGCGVVRLHRVRSESPFERKAVMYRVDGSNYQRDPYTSFHAPPGQLVRQLTGEWLSQARVFDMVLEPGDSRVEDWILVGKVKRVFVDRRTGVYDETVLEVEFTLLERSRMDPIFERSYGAIVTAGPGDALDIAWAESLSRVLRGLESDLRVLVRGTSRCAGIGDGDGSAQAVLEESP